MCQNKRSDSDLKTQAAETHVCFARARRRSKGQITVTDRNRHCYLSSFFLSSRFFFSYLWFWHLSGLHWCIRWSFPNLTFCITISSKSQLTYWSLQSAVISVYTFKNTIFFDWHSFFLSTSLITNPRSFWLIRGTHRNISRILSSDLDVNARHTRLNFWSVSEEDY